ncbi:MAG: hypothetical protein ACO1QS_08005 [Verrucomicrobiota bacterium]
MGNKLTIVIALLLVAGMGFLFHRQQKFQSAWQSERAAWEDRLATQQQQQTQALTAQQTATEQAARLQEQLATVTNELVTAKLQVEAYEAKRQLEAQAHAAESKKVADLEQLKAAVPAPTVTTNRTPAGKEQRNYTFAKLLAPGGNTLATEAEFRTQFGRRFVFRAGANRPLAYDVDELHPGVLLHLGLNREAALSAQSDIDRQAQLAEQKYRAQLAARAEAEKKMAEQRAKMAVEYAKIAEERRKSQLDEQLKLQAAETERMKAEASMRAADAAVQEALRPFYPEYFIQQVLTPPPVIVVPGQPATPQFR